MKAFPVFMVVFLFALIFGGVAASQSLTLGSITGRITDPGHAGRPDEPVWKLPRGDSSVRVEQLSLKLNF